MKCPVSAAAILFVITIVPWWAAAKTTLDPFWRTAADQGVFSRYTDFSKGIIDTGSVVFFIIMTMSLLDVLAGVVVTIISARRDVEFAGQH